MEGIQSILGISFSLLFSVFLLFQILNEADNFTVIFL